ncbi:MULTISPECIES: DUF6282 family protein [Roseobacteraceae]|uniref:Cytosolic protein n=1 Tax=Pseudosulfitobacter pseudonitzschiae TaxID=1402135 RepID=A0A221K8E1_9RHOB|nr:MULTISPECIES: DUF6282 family protein [Roseobacteraceae]ASM75133.1 hypothetical protein SULPSESMR1_04410 [Pseudosulfitobacter pseudonitzschiae]
MTEIEVSEGEKAAQISEILQGAVDPHVHSGPSIAPRAVDHLDLAKTYSDAGFAAVVTKDHDYSGVMCAQLIRDHHPELKTRIFSGIALNNVIGGFNVYAVEHTAAMDGRIVWLPTLAAENHLEWEKTSGWEHPASTQKIRPASPIPLFQDGKLRPEVLDVLDVIAKTGMALASGHIHVSETKIVFAEAKRRGVERLIFTHPEDIVGASFEDTKEIAKLGAYVEHSLGFFIEGSKFRNRSNEELREFIDCVGFERTILCSDLGQVGTLLPLEGLRRGVATCLSLGYSDAEIHAMVATNAGAVIGLDD